MAITINEISSGIGLIIDGEIYSVLEYQHVKPGKGSAFVRIKMKNIKTDAVLERTFRSAEKLDDAVLEENELEFLYKTDNDFHFMDHTTYEEVVLGKDALAQGMDKFLLENLTLTGLYYNNKLIKVILPNFIIAQVVATEPGIRGDSTKSGGKPGRIQTGAVVQIPLFINVDDWIKIDTRSGAYVERVQK